MTGTLTLYHGSLRDFARERNVAPRFNSGQSLLGHFCTDSAALALVYARPTEDESEDNDDDVEEGYVYVVEASASSLKVEPVTPSGLSLIERMQMDFRDADFMRYLEDLKADGHDGACFETADGYCEYLFFDTDAISIVDRFTAGQFASAQNVTAQTRAEEWKPS